MSSQLSLLLIVGNVFLQQIGLPIPVAPTLVVAGAIAADSHWWGGELFLGAVAACVLTDLSWFFAGRRHGARIMRMLCWMSLTPDSCVSETQLRFERWGPNAILVAKFIPGLGTIAPPFAGALRMDGLRFLGLSAAGSVLWVGALLAAGMLLKPQIDRLLPNAEKFGAAALLMIGALIVGYIAYKLWKRHRFYSKLRMARITVAELHQLLETNRAPLIVDVRLPSATAVDSRRIPSAVHVPLNEAGKHLENLPRDGEIILYCTCPNEASAAQVAKLLIDNGFTRVRPLHGGLDAWIAAGYPVESLPEAVAEVAALLAE